MKGNSETGEAAGEQRNNITRRTMIGTSLAMLTGLAGCSSSGGNTSPGTGTPEEFIEEYARRLENPSKDKINAMIADNGSMEKVTEGTRYRLGIRREHQRQLSPAHTWSYGPMASPHLPGTDQPDSSPAGARPLSRHRPSRTSSPYRPDTVPLDVPDRELTA